MDVPSAPSSLKRKRRNDGSLGEDVSFWTAPSNNPRHHLSGIQDLNRGSVTALSPSPYTPHFATNEPPNGDWTRAKWTMAQPYALSPSSYAPHFATNEPPNGDWTRAKWTMAQPPYVPPYGKWIRAPPPFSFLRISRGMKPPAYDPELPPLKMPPPLMMPPPQYVSQSASSSLTTAPPPPYVSRFAAPPKFAPVSQRHTDCFWVNEPHDTIARYGRRSDRQARALNFKGITSQQIIKSVRKHCILESATYDLLDKSFGITWVAVRGMDSMCVVTRDGDLVHLAHMDRRVKRLDTENFLRSFWNAIVSEVEDIEDPSGACEVINNSSVKPFGVVCVVSGSNNEVQKASSVEYDAEKAIKFLREEIKTDSAFTFDKTVLTAISAFQQLFLQEFTAAEIRVFAWKRGYVIGKELQQEREDPDMEELLASLNGPDNDPGTV